MNYEKSRLFFSRKWHREIDEEATSHHFIIVLHASFLKLVTIHVVVIWVS